MKPVPLGVVPPVVVVYRTNNADEVLTIGRASIEHEMHCHKSVPVELVPSNTSMVPPTILVATNSRKIVRCPPVEAPKGWMNIILWVWCIRYMDIEGMNDRYP